MKIFRLVNFLLIVFLLAACSPLLKDGVLLQNSPFANGCIPYLYDSIPSTQIFDFNLNFKKSEVKGIVIIKTFEKGERRIVMTSLFGMTFLDFELIGDKIKVNYCIDQLNKDKVIRLIKTDFNILFIPNYSKRTKYCFSSNSRIDSLEQGRGITKVVMRFSNYKNNWPETIQIAHPYLSIFLSLNKTEYD